MNKFESLKLDLFQDAELTEVGSILGGKMLAVSGTGTNVGPTGNFESDYDPDDCEHQNDTP